MITKYAQIIKRLPGWLFRLGAQSYIDQEYPRHLFIETTATCNLTCTYCPRERTKSDMDFGLFKEIVNEAKKYGPRSFSLHLFGEPLLYPRIIDACEYIKSANRRNTVLLTTNGTKLNEFVDSLTSIDQIYWTWREEAKFTERTLKKLKQWGKFRVRIINELTPLDELMRWKSWPNIEYRNLHNYGGDIQVSGYGVLNMEKRWPCYHLWFAPAVSWNGNILLCCADPHQKDIIQKFPSVHEAWTGDKINEVRESHLNGNYVGICKNCDVWKSYPSIHGKSHTFKSS